MFVESLGQFPDGVQGGSWDIECVDCPKWFYGMTDRSLRLDVAGHSHIAYGRDHLYYAWHDGAQWHYETVDSNPGVGLRASIALDGGGYPHITYFDTLNQTLKYARYDGVDWLIETVAGPTPTTSGYASLALDGAGHPHILYFDYAGGYFYAWHDGSTWHIEPGPPACDAGDRSASLALDAAGIAHVAYCCARMHYAWYDGSTWHEEHVGSNEYCEGADVSMVLDAAGQPHVSWYDGHFYYTWMMLHYGWRDDNGWWHTRIVDGTEYYDDAVGAYNSIALDTAGHPHIGYHYYGGEDDLKHAWYDGTTWHREIVDSEGHVGELASLALDADNRPHISYYDATNDDLKHAWHDGTTWHREIVDSEGYAGGYSSLALDVDDRPHISYHEGSSRDLKHAWHDGTTWHKEIVDSEGYAGGYSSLALDVDERPHISYYDDSNKDLKYAQYDGAAWHLETVESQGDVGWFTSLALDADDRPHISYYDDSNKDLKYAWHDGTTWHLETVDGEGDVGWFTSLALDASNRPHISYYDDTNEDLKHAWHDGTTWLREIVDGAGDAGGYTSLALDTANQPHISYLDWENRDLKYAHYDGAAWHLETVESQGDVGWFTSLALDADDRPHISYYDGNNDDLKYAYLDGSAWQIETVDSAVGDVGRATSTYTSVALDTADRPHISYQDSTNRDLKYAEVAPTPAFKTPVIVVPGYLASLCLPYSQAQDLCWWTAKRADDVYGPLKEAFEQVGYQEGENFYYCRYKWWRPNEETAGTYLEPCIDEALADNPGAAKVYLITHSNGGNVARSYIQADGSSRVDKLLMIAPPNEGAVRAYWPWEGGDLSQEDFWVRTIYDMILFLLSRVPPSGAIRFELFHQFMPSLRELMPVGEPFLYNQDTDQIVDPADMVWDNEFLPPLNANLDVLLNDVSKVVVYASTGHDTHEWIDVRSHNPLLDGLLWQDGKPVGLRKTSDGDGSILLSRASLPISPSSDYDWRPLYSQNHSDLVSEVIPDILEELGLPQVSLLDTRLVEAGSDQDVLFFAATTSARVLISDPQGRQTGYRSNGQFVNEIPGAEYLGEEGGAEKIIVIPSPVFDGQYQIQISGTNIAQTEAYAFGAFSYEAGGALLITGDDLDPDETVSQTINYTPHQLYLPLVLKGGR